MVLVQCNLSRAEGVNIAVVLIRGGLTSQLHLMLQVAVKVDIHRIPLALDGQVEPPIHRDIVNVRPVVPGVIAVHVDAETVPVTPAKDTRAHQRVHLAVALVEDMVQLFLTLLEGLALNLNKHRIAELYAGTLVL